MILETFMHFLLNILIYLMPPFYVAPVVIKKRSFHSMLWYLFSGGMRDQFFLCLPWRRRSFVGPSGFWEVRRKLVLRNDKLMSFA